MEGCGSKFLLWPHPWGTLEFVEIVEMSVKCLYSKPKSVPQAVEACGSKSWLCSHLRATLEFVEILEMRVK